MVELETALAESGPLVKKGTIPHESVTLDEEEKVLLSSDIFLVTWCS